MKRSINHPDSDSAPGLDGVPTRVLQTVADTLATPLVCIYNACLDEGYCPEHFREAKTIALRKPGKHNYTKPKSYRPIALLNTLGKVMERIITERLS